MTERQEAQLFDQETRRLLKDLAHRLRSHRKEIADKWADAYRNSPSRAPDVHEEEGISRIYQLVSVFPQHVEQGHFEKFFEQAKAVGRIYAEEELPYAHLTLAAQIFEEVIVPFINQAYPQPAEAQETLAAFHQFNLSLLSILISSYQEAKEEELRRQYEGRQAELKRRRDQLISTVVHDFRGPLTSIMGFSQLIEKALAKGKTCEPRQVEIIAREAKQLERMANELAELSMVEAGRIELERKPTDIVIVAGEVVAELQPTSPLHNLILKVPSQPVVGNWDAKRLDEVFRYLIENAIKLSPEGGEINIAVERPGNSVKVSVADQGVAIPRELLPLAFEPYSRFYRERRIKGMGVGLFIAKGIIEALGGEIWAESEPGKGSNFQFVLPLK